MSVRKARSSSNISRELVPVDASMAPLTTIHAPDATTAWKGRVVHRALRGRYALAVVLALLSAIAGGWAGWRFTQPIYRSEGLLRIAYKLPTVLKQNEWNGPMDMFETNLRAQQQVIGSRRTIQQALRLPVWQETGRGDSTAVVDQIAKNLTVEHPNGTDYLRASVTDTDPAVAAAAIRAIVKAYVAIYDSHDSDYEKKMLETLTQIRVQAGNSLDACQRDLDAAVHEFGTTDLSKQCEGLASQVEELERRLAQIELALAVRRVERKSEGASGGATANAPTVPTVEELAAVGGQLASQLADRSRIAGQIDQLKRLYGERHPLLEQLRAQLAVTQDQIERSANEYDKLLARRPRSASAALDSIFGNQPVEVLEAQQEQISSLRETTRQKMIALGIRRSQLDKTKARADQLRTELVNAQTKLDEMAVESTFGGRLSVVSSGEIPVTPFLDRRPKLAAAGAFVGACLPIGMLVLWGTMRNRYRYANEAECGVPLLGILPRLSRELNGAESIGVAHSVHRIRAMLQVSQTPGEPATYLITSASAGEGKTSVTAALGLSFAASGSRTLMIDSDSIGQQLSSRFKTHGMPGLRDALGEGRLDGCIKQLDERLFIMPIGGHEVGDTCTTSPAALRRLFKEAGSAFDVVLVDSGPLLGTVEPILIAPAVYGVILAVARGQRHDALDDAMGHLKEIGAKIAGLVFNFAERKDFQRSTSVSADRLAGASQGTGGESMSDLEDAMPHPRSQGAMTHLHEILARSQPARTSATGLASGGLETRT